jgi:hypothetical protein
MKSGAPCAGIKWQRRVRLEYRQTEHAGRDKRTMLKLLPLYFIGIFYGREHDV